MRKKIDYKKVFKILCFITCIVVVISLCFVPSVYADVGNNNRYESDIDTSYDSSSGDGDIGDIFWLIYLLSEIIGPLPTLILVIVFILLMASKVKKKKFIISNKKNGTSTIVEDVNGNNIIDAEDIKSAMEKDFGFPLDMDDGTHQTVTYSQTVYKTNGKTAVEAIRENDPNFSEEKFLAWVREVFVKIQQAWTARDWSIVRPFESNSLFSQHQAQLQEYIDNNKINRIEKIAIQSAVLRSFNSDGAKEVLTVELHAVMRDYVVDATTNNVVEGDPTKDWRMKYLMTFERKAGIKTAVSGENKFNTTNCPNCGAPTTITSAGRCDYCGSVITTDNHGWVLNDIRSIK